MLEVWDVYLPFTWRVSPQFCRIVRYAGSLITLFTDHVYIRCVVYILCVVYVWCIVYIRCVVYICCVVYIRCIGVVYVWCVVYIRCNGVVYVWYVVYIMATLVCVCAVSTILRVLIVHRMNTIYTILRIPLLVLRLNSLHVQRSRTLSWFL